jgi:hypothetical protein
MASYQPSRAHSIRSNIVHGLMLCAIIRTEGRMGSASRAELLLAKTKRIVEIASLNLRADATLPPHEKHMLGTLLDQLRASIGGLDPLWIPNDGPIRTKSDPLPHATLLN